MDPLAGVAAFQGLKAVVSLVAGWRSGKADAAQLHQLAVRYWGCVLLEFSNNLKNVRESISRDDDSLPVLTFTFAEALLPELARLAPLPITVTTFGSTVGTVQELAELVALDRQVSAQPRQNNLTIVPSNVRVVWRAKASALLPTLERALVGMRAAVAAQGKDAFGDEDWQTLETSILPIDVPGAG